MGRKNKRGYELRTASEKQSLLKHYRSSGESMSVFCAERGLSVSTLHSWVTKDLKRAPERKGKAEIASAGSKFIELPCKISHRPESSKDIKRHSVSLQLRLGSLLKVEYLWSAQ